MNRESIGRAALGLYPQNVRDTQGEELLGTLLDAGDASLSEFLAQLASVVVSGMAARSRQALSAPVGVMLGQVLCWVAVALVTRILSVALATGLRFGGWSTLPFATVATLFLLPALALALFTAGQARVTGLIGLAWLVWSYEQTPHFQALRILLELAPAAIGFMVVAIAPRRAPKTGRSLWLVPAGITLLVALTTEHYLLSVGTSRLIPALAALLFLPIQPAFALGTALAASVWASQMLLYGGPGQTLTIALSVIITPAAVIVARVARRAATHR